MDKKSSNLSVVRCSSNILHWESYIFIYYIQYFHKFSLSLSNNLLLCNFSITYVYTLFIRMPKVLSIFVQLASIQVHSKVKFPISKTGRLVLKKMFFCVGEYTEYGFDQQKLIWYVFRLWGMVFSRTPQAKNAVSNFVDQTISNI